MRLRCKFRTASLLGSLSAAGHGLLLQPQPAGFPYARLPGHSRHQRTRSGERKDAEHQRSERLHYLRCEALRTARRRRRESAATDALAARPPAPPQADRL